MAAPLPHAARTRSLYRSLLRELPSRPAFSASPIQQRIRRSLDEASAKPESDAARQLAQAEQFLGYVQAQRMYATLVERYNPGAAMDEEERLRLTMRRVGMNAPVEWKPEGKE